MWHGPPSPPLGLTISPSSSSSPVTPRLHSGKLGLSRTSARLTGRVAQQNYWGNSPITLYLPPVLPGKKSSGRSSAMPEGTTSPLVMSGITPALSPKLCDPSSQRKISAALKTFSTLPSSCWTETSARMRKTSGGPSGILRPLYQSQTLLIPTAEAGRQEVEPPPNISITFDGKTHSSLKAIARAFNMQFIASSAQQDRAIRRFMRNIHYHHRVDPSHRPFDERGVAAVIMKAGSSTAQGPDGLTMLHLRHLGPHGLAFLTELFNLSVAGINIQAIWKTSVIIPILKARKPRE